MRPVVAAGSPSLLRLRNVAMARERIRHANAELGQFADVRRLLSHDPTMPRGRRGGATDAMANRVIELEQRERRLRELIAQWVAEQEDADRLIATLDEPVEAMVLHMVYVEERDVPDVAAHLHCSRKTVYAIHNRAIARLDEGGGRR